MSSKGGFLKKFKVPGAPVVKNLPCNARDMGLISGPGRFHVLWSNKTCMPQLQSPRLLKLAGLEPMLCNKRNDCSEKPENLNEEYPLFAITSKRKKEKSFSWVQLFVTPWTLAEQAPPSMGFSRQEYWSGLPFPSPVTTRDKSKKKVLKLQVG